MNKREKNNRGSLFMGVIALSAVMALAVFFILRRQSESVKVILMEVSDAQSRRLLSDAAMKLASKLQDDRLFYENAYDCDTSPTFKHLLDVGFPAEYQNVYFSCHVPIALGEFYLKLEMRKSLNSKSGSGISVQGTKCRKTIFSFNVKGPGKVSFEYNPAIADPSDHKWSGGPVAQAACAVNSTCYEWPAPTTLPHTIVLKSTCSSSMTKAHLNNSNISKLNTTFKDMPGLDWINLNYNSLTSLAGNTFQGLSNLEQLHLFDNDLGPALDSSLLSGLTKLKTLDLRFNILKSFPADQFATNAKLQTMYLANNKIGPNLSGTDFPPTLLAPLVDLDWLYMEFNELERIVPNSFSTNAKLKDLNLSHNKLPNLESGAFNGLVELQAIHFFNNLLTPQLPADIFSPLVKLQTLDLRYNQLKSFPPTQFSANTKLRTIYLSYNKIGPNLTGTDFPSTLLAPLVDLDWLEMTNNEIARLVPNTFLTNAKLKELNLSYNKLANLESGAFNGLVELQAIHFFNNLLTPQLPADIFSPLVKLQTLDLRYNQLKSFPPTQFSTNTKLRTIYLANNEIGANLTGTDFPSTLLAPLVDLDWLYMEYNEIERFVPNTFSTNAKLRELNLSHNKLANLESGAFNGLVELQAIHFFNNLLSPQLPADIFNQLVKLRSLDLRYNQLNSTYLNQLLQTLLTTNDLRYIGIGFQIPKPAIANVNVTALTSKGVEVSYDP